MSRPPREKRPSTDLLIERLSDALNEADSTDITTLREALAESGIDADRVLAECKQLLASSQLTPALPESSRVRQFLASTAEWLRRPRLAIATAALATAVLGSVGLLLNPYGPLAPKTRVLLVLGEPARSPDVSHPTLAHLNALPVEVRLVPDGKSRPVLLRAAVDMDVGAGYAELPASFRGIVLAHGRSTSTEYAGVGRMEPGVNLITLGEPGSSSKAAFDLMASLYDDAALRSLLFPNLPFVVQTAEAEDQPTTVRTTLSDSVGAVYFDDVAVFDDTRLIWSETFETTASGSYPNAPLTPIYPRENPSRTDAAGIPQGLVTQSRAVEGERAFLSLSLPGHAARIDGIRLKRADISSGVLRYRASVYMTVADARGALVGLKQDAGQHGQWYDKAGVLFSHGEIRVWSSNRLLGNYEPGQWYRIEIVADLGSETMSVNLGGREIARELPMFNPEGIQWENPTWTEAQVEDFDWFSFGGTFAPPRETGSEVSITVVREDAGVHTYQLDGARPGWQPTPIRLNPGDRLVVSASGDIRYALPSPARTGPDGCLILAPDPCANRDRPDLHSAAPAPDQFGCSLVARIGNGIPFFVGRSLEIAVAESGTLAFAYNDSYYGDNEGHFRITISH